MIQILLPAPGELTVSGFGSTPFRPLPQTNPWGGPAASSPEEVALEGVCDVDLDALDVELPRGFGRD